MRGSSARTRRCRRSSSWTAASVASLLLTTEAMVAEKPKEEEAGHGHGGMPGGMPGM